MLQHLWSCARLSKHWNNYNGVMERCSQALYFISYSLYLSFFVKIFGECNKYRDRSCIYEDKWITNQSVVSPPYSPDLGVYVFFFLLQLKIRLKSNCPDPHRPSAQKKGNHPQRLWTNDLPMIKIILIALIKEEIYDSLIYRGLPQGNKRNSDLLYIDQHIFKETKVMQEKCSCHMDWLQKGLW